MEPALVDDFTASLDDNKALMEEGFIGPEYWQARVVDALDSLAKHTGLASSILL